MTHEEHERAISSALHRLNRALSDAGLYGFFADASSKITSKYGDHDRSVVSIILRKEIK